MNMNNHLKALLIGLSILIVVGLVGTFAPILLLAALGVAMAYMLGYIIIMGVERNKRYNK